MDNRPIKGNPKGEYDLNFIDPSNDIPAYYDGMVELEEMIDLFFETVNFQKPEINQPETVAFQVKSQDFKLSSQCSVCLTKFKDKEQINILPCKHCFHKQCVRPWFAKNDKCPNCRFSLSKNEE